MRSGNPLPDGRAAGGEERGETAATAAAATRPGAAEEKGLPRGSSRRSCTPRPGISASEQAAGSRTGARQRRLSTVTPVSSGARASAAVSGAPLAPAGRENCSARRGRTLQPSQPARPCPGPAHPLAPVPAAGRRARKLMAGVAAYRCPGVRLVSPAERARGAARERR